MSEVGHPTYDKPYLWMICLVATLGGFLFGYDWVVVGVVFPGGGVYSFSKRDRFGDFDYVVSITHGRAKQTATGVEIEGGSGGLELLPAQPR